MGIGSDPKKSKKKSIPSWKGPNLAVVFAVIVFILDWNPLTQSWCSVASSAPINAPVAPRTLQDAPMILRNPRGESVLHPAAMHQGKHKRKKSQWKVNTISIQSCVSLADCNTELFQGLIKQKLNTSFPSCKNCTECSGCKHPPDQCSVW